MALVYKNGRPYLYRSVRRGGRVTSECVGCGFDAQIIAALEDMERDERRCDLERIRQEREAFDAVERALDELAERARALAHDTLAAAGYHRHRGQWRKHRVSASRHQESESAAGDGRLGGSPVDRMGRGEVRQRDDEGEAAR